MQGINNLLLGFFLLFYHRTLSYCYFLLAHFGLIHWNKFFGHLLSLNRPKYIYSKKTIILA